MSTLRNQVQLIGRLGADAEVRTTNQGTKVSQLRLATNEYIKTSHGEWKENTQWHSLVVWGELNKIVEQHGKKGIQFIVQGSLLYREFTDTQDIKRVVAEIKVSKLMPIDTIKSSPEDTSIAIGEESEDLPF